MEDNKQLENVQNEINESVNSGDSNHDKKQEEEPKFTQAEVDRIIKERLEREKRKREEALERERQEAERKRLEEQEQYKELYEKLKAELAEKEAKALEASKRALLAQAGYTEGQVNRYVKYITGNTEEELKASLEELKADIPPKTAYVDPSVMNPRVHTPKQESGYDYGKSLYERIRGKKR
jgi:S-adenosylmethionine:diacylglycerol 3-amino-3-carboxypropyl transferase